MKNKIGWVFKLKDFDLYLHRSYYLLTPGFEHGKFCFSPQSRSATIQQIKNYFPEESNYRHFERRRHDAIKFKNIKEKKSFLEKNINFMDLEENIVCWKDFEILKIELKPVVIESIPMIFLNAPDYIKEWNKKIST